MIYNKSLGPIWRICLFITIFANGAYGSDWADEDDLLGPTTVLHRKNRDKSCSSDGPIDYSYEFATMWMDDGPYDYSNYYHKVGMNDEEIEEYLKRAEKRDLFNGEEVKGICSICKNDLVDENQLLIHSLPCGHYYHKECIVQRLKKIAACKICKIHPVTGCHNDPDGCRLF